MEPNEPYIKYSEEYYKQYLEDTSRVDVSHLADTKPTQSIEVSNAKPNSTLRKGHHIVRGPNGGEEDMGEYDQELVAREWDAGQIVDFDKAVRDMQDKDYLNQSPQSPKY